MNAVAQGLDDGLAQLGIADRDRLIDPLMRFLALLAKWNRVFSLTAVDTPESAVSVHLLDSLAVVPHIDAARVLDVGTGPGLPGIPLALARPDARVVLLEANAKKCAFLRQCVAELRMSNVEVVQQRAEAWRSVPGFPAIVSRAFASLADFLRLTRHLLAPGGRWFAMKGVLPTDELGALPVWARVERTLPLAVPGLNAQRHLIIAGLAESP